MRCHLFAGIALLVVALAFPAAATTCNDYPFDMVIGPGGYTEYVLNDTCLSGTSSSPAYVSNAPYCLGGAHAWQWQLTTTTRKISKTFNIPADRTNTNWELAYVLDKVDPLHDGWWTSLRVKVLNITDGTTVAQHTYWGDDPDVTCADRLLTFSRNLAGKTIRVEFEGQIAGSSTQLRVKLVSLAQFQ